MAGDPYWNNVVLAMHMDDVGLSDLKGHAATLNGNATRSAVQSRFGGYSAYFDGVGDYLTTPQLITSIAFTIEAWVRIAATTPEQTFFAQYSSNVGRSALYLNASGKLEFFIAGTPNLLITAPSTFSINTFEHIAVTREAGGTTRLFIGGNLVASGSSTQALDATPCSIGGQYSTAFGLQRPLTGYIDDLRVTNGVARYTTNFAPPTEAFPSTPPQISGTVKDSTGAFVARTVRAYRRSDGILTGSTTSNGTTGAFTVSAYDDTAHFVTAFDYGAENALIFDNITPL